MTRLYNAGRTALSYIATHPGCSILEVNAVRTARGGHAAMYETVHRLLRAGLVRDCRLAAAMSGATGRYHLFVTDAGAARL
jgi:hypothetical protein